ncbi:prepilin-type N-terminal cleavage/methylation domain-containing protein [Virgibacillus necropolis]|uniref:competence type IV pilus major pilin ComGC n=1 Tax=Virgibacillus necropolis TaxID=163877 RepID=UPI00384D5167
MFKSQKGFTLIEMLIVLMIISVLIILIIPNISKKSEEVYDKGCKALISVVQTQAEAYYLDNGSHPATTETLVTAGYITEEQKTCKNGDAIPLKTSSS